MGTQPLSSKRGQPPPQFLAHFYCGQTAGCIKMPLCTKVDLSPGDSVLDGDPASSPIFRLLLLWPNVWMHQDASWYGGRPQPRGLCVRWGPKPLPQKGWSPPNFRSTSIVAKRLHRSRCHLLRRHNIVFDQINVPM